MKWPVPSHEKLFEDGFVSERNMLTRFSLRAEQVSSKPPKWATAIPWGNFSTII
jgi:hypothetical protein